MGVDSRGVEGGNDTKCDCEKYEAKDGQNECGYCGCFPAQNERSRSESSECHSRRRSADNKRHTEINIPTSLFLTKKCCLNTTFIKVK